MSDGERPLIVNKKARHNYHLEKPQEAGIELQGWEIKSLRAGRAQIVDSYVISRGGEIWLLGSVITPLPDADLNADPAPDPTRTRKLLLRRSEIAKLDAALRRKGYSCVCTSLYWKKNRVKCAIALAKGKKLHDKREDAKRAAMQRESEAEQSRAVRGSKG